MINLKNTLLAGLTFLFSFSSHALVAEKIQQVCGLSDTVYQYIRETAGEKSVTQHPLSATVGSARRMIIYADQSWILTLEFLSPGQVEADRTCIIAKGNLSNQELATDIMKRTEWIGPMQPVKEKTPEPTSPEVKPNVRKNYLIEA